MPGRHRERHTTFLIAPSATRAGGTIVYAVRMRSAAEALAAVAGQEGTGGDQPVIVGSLSTRTAKAMGLKQGEIRRV